MNQPPPLIHILTQMWSFKCVFFYAAINITRARFSGSDEFGYTSFVAYSSIPSLSLFYEFKLKFTLASNSSAVKDNLILFAGHKGQGEPHAAQQFKIILSVKWKEKNNSETAP